MKITNVKKMGKETPGNTVAFFEVDFGDHVIRDLKLLKSPNGGYFVGSPSRAYEKDGKKNYFDFIILREELKKMITSRAIGQIIKGNTTTDEEDDSDVPE